MRHGRLKIETIQVALRSNDRHTAMAGVVAVKNNTNITKDILDKWRVSDNCMEQAAALYSGRCFALPSNYLQMLREISQFCGGEFACKIFGAVCKQRRAIFKQFPPEQYEEFYSARTIFDCITSMPVSSIVVRKWLRPNKWYYTLAALYGLLLMPDHIEFDELFQIFMSTNDFDIADAVMQVCSEKGISDRLWQMLYDKSESVTKRTMVMRYAGFAKSKLIFFPEKLSTHEERVALRYLGFHEALFNHYWKSDDPAIKEAMLYYCIGRREVPFVVINSGLHSDNPDVRNAALELGAHYGSVKIRDFEPPAIVYKKCANDVIVSAKIPSTAHVRGYKGKGRASNATIVDIRGGFCGEKVGISMYDHKTQYCIGDKVEISCFDYSDKQDATGFHFFTDYDEARKFYL